MFTQQLRRILLHSIPMFIALFISMGMPLIDTILLGHFRTEDLAAMAVGIGIYIPVMLSLTGVLQAGAPIIAQHKGAGNDEGIARTLQQTFWLALLLAIPGMVFLYHPDIMFKLSPISPTIESKARLYMQMLAWGLPGAMLYRVFYVFCNALKQPKPLVLIAMLGTSLHGFLAWSLVTGQWGLPALGVQGSGISNACSNFCMMLACAFYIARHPNLRTYRLFGTAPYGLDAKVLKELLRMGIPMGLSSFVEVSSFTVTAIFIAQLGSPVVAGHRLISSLATVCYMLPLSISIATLTQIGHAAGAQDWLRARSSALAGFVLASALALLVSLTIWLCREALVNMYSVDPLVRQIALSLILYVVLYQLFDAMQTLSAFALRGYKIAVAPMLVHIICFWGIGLGGGWWLSFRAENPLGVQGFWMAALTSLIIAAILLGCLLYWFSNRPMRTDAPLRVS